MKKVFLLCALVCLTVSSAEAGFYSQSYDASGSVAVALQLDNKEIYNLIISIELLRKPQDGKVYESDNYENMMKQISVGWQNVAIQKTLDLKTIKFSDLCLLKSNIEKGISELIQKAKIKNGISSDVEVVYSLSNFYLLEPKYN